MSSLGCRLIGVPMRIHMQGDAENFLAQPDLEGIQRKILMFGHLAKSFLAPHHICLSYHFSTLIMICFSILVGFSFCRHSFFFFLFF